MEVDDLKNLIRDIIAQEMGDGGEEELGVDDMDAGAEMEPAMDDMEAGAEDDEIDLDELLAELESATNEEVKEEVTEEVEEEVNEEVVTEEEVKEEDNSELTEALATIETLQNQLQEVNLLNAKLMYVNKVFKANNLSESQKVNIIAAFDKAETVKEVKLVFETVSENVVNKKATKVNESKLGMASKPTGTTATKPEVISEVSDAVRRMQKLAGII
jgi:vacuolar-type H+-ATPase subunit I/STV1